MLPLKIYSGYDEKRLFDHILRINRRIFEIQTAYVKVWLKWWLDIFILKNYFKFEQQNSAKTPFLNIFPFRIERVTASLIYILDDTFSELTEQATKTLLLIVQVLLKHLT